MMRMTLVLSLALAVPAVAETPTHAIAVLHAPDGKYMGTIHFMGGAKGVSVSGEVKGLSAGKHGFHVHEFGDCSAADFTSAGSHFNPGGDPHAGPMEAHRHAGDLGNVEAGADGSAKVDAPDTKLAFDGAMNVIGRAVIVHQKADDLKTQPTGDAGGRLACGVVGVAKSEAGAAHQH